MGKYLGVDGLKALLMRLDGKFVKKDEYLNLQPNIILSTTSELDIQEGSFIIISKPTNYCIIKNITDVPGVDSPIYVQLRTNEDFTIQYTPNIKWSSPLSLQTDKCYLIELHKNYVESGWLGRCAELTLVEEQEIIEITKEVWGRIDKFELMISGTDGWEKYNDKYIVHRGAPSVEALVDAVVDYKVTRGEEVERYSNSGSHEIVSNVDWIETSGDKVTILDYSKDEDGRLTCKLYDENGKYIISEQIHIINSLTEFTIDYIYSVIGIIHECRI